MINLSWDMGVDPVSLSSIIMSHARVPISIKALSHRCYKYAFITSITYSPCLCIRVCANQCELEYPGHHLSLLSTTISKITQSESNFLSLVSTSVPSLTEACNQQSSILIPLAHQCVAAVLGSLAI